MARIKGLDIMFSPNIEVDTPYEIKLSPHEFNKLHIPEGYRLLHIPFGENKSQINLGKDQFERSLTARKTDNPDIDEVVVWFPNRIISRSHGLLIYDGDKVTYDEHSSFGTIYSAGNTSLESLVGTNRVVINHNTVNFGLGDLLGLPVHANPNDMPTYVLRLYKD